MELSIIISMFEIIKYFTINPTIIISLKAVYTLTRVRIVQIFNLNKIRFLD